jgi:hypothetical protein
MDVKKAETVKCEGCGEEIFFVTPVNGKRVPINRKRVPVYFKLEDDERHPPDSWIKKTAYLSHFVTCPKRDQFSKKKVSKKEDRRSMLPQGERHERS